MREEPSAELFRTRIHPRLYFGPDDIAALRERAQTGRPARILAEILRRCEQYGDPKSESYIDLEADRDSLFQNWGRGSTGGVPLCGAAHCLSFAYALTGDRDYASRAIAVIRKAVGPGTPPRCAEGGPTDASTLEGELPIAYDLVYDQMSDADRRNVEGFLRQTMVEPYRRQTVHKPGPIFGIGINIFLHQFHLYTRTLFALYDPDQDKGALEEVASLMRRSFHVGMDDGGVIGEGPSYGWGDLEWLSFAAQFLRRAGVADFWREEPRFAEMARHWVHLVLPGGRGQNTPGDAWRFAGGRPPIALLLHARRLHDPALVWAWEKMGGRGSVPGFGTAPEYFTMHLGPAAIWEGDDLVASTPDAAGYPASRLSGHYGVVTARSGWSDDDLYFSILGAGRTAGCFIHQHKDAGHFCLFALNEAFSIDSGYGDGDAIYHSVMLPEGQEPQPFVTAEWTGGRVLRFAAGRHADFCTIDAQAHWLCQYAYRHALVVKAPGADPYVVISDNANFRSAYSFYHWLVNSEPGNRIETDPAQERATIHGQVHRLECAWAYPAANEYPTRHILELAADEIDSKRIPRDDGDVDYRLGLCTSRRRLRGFSRWGAGIRPRLVATLSGYNGALLSVLVPRRRESPPISVARLSGPHHYGLVIDHGDVVDTVVTNPFDRVLSLGGMEGEATVAVARRSRDGTLLWWVAADAYALSIDGKDVLPRQGVPATLRESPR
jgi:hypothetical protein